MIRKLFAGGVVVAVAAVALLLVTLVGPAKPASAAVNSIGTAPSPAVINAGGTALVSISADNLGASAGGTSQVWTLTVTGCVAGNTYTLTFNGQTTAAITCNTTAPAASLNALTGVGAGGFTDGAGAACAPAVGSYTCTETAGASLASAPQPNMTATIGAGFPVTVSSAITTPGALPAGAGNTALQIITTVGTMTLSGTSCTGAICVGAGLASGTTIIVPATNNLNGFTLTYTAPAVGPANASVTAIQGATSKTIAITVRGTVAKVTLNAYRAPVAAGAALCAGVPVSVLASNTYLGVVGLGAVAVTNLCTTAADSAGNLIAGTPVVYSVDNGTLSVASANTNANGIGGDGAAPVTLTASATSNSGTVANLTATSGGVSATTQLKYGGNATACALSANPASVQVGGSATVAVSYTDATGGPTADGPVPVNTQTNPGAGANAAVVGGGTLIGGATKFTIIAAIPGALSVSSNIGNTVCTITIQATGTLATPTPGGTGTPAAGGTGTIVSGSIPAGGGFGLIVFGGGTTAQLVTASGCPAATAAFWFTSGGNFIVYIPGTTVSAVNAAFLAIFVNGVIPANTPFLGKCV